MKKYLALGFIIIVPALFWLLQNKNLGRSDIKSVKTESMEESGTTKTNNVQPKQFFGEKAEQVAYDKTSVKLDTEYSQENCHKRYQNHENWQKISDIFESFYMTAEEMSGDHHFQKMTLESVKSYADAGDVSAMFHYGTELLWKGGFGIYFNPLNRPPTQTQEKRQELAKSHQLDLNTLEQGTKYLIGSAVLGKLGGLIELKLIHHHILKKQIRDQKDIESIKNALVLSIAYGMFLEQVFINDRGMMEGFLYSEETEQILDKLEDTNPDAEIATIKHEAEIVTNRLIDNWKEQREIAGLPVYPNKFPPYLEQHIQNKIKECNE